MEGIIMGTDGPRGARGKKAYIYIYIYIYICVCVCVCVWQRTELNVL